MYGSRPTSKKYIIQIKLTRTIFNKILHNPLLILAKATCIIKMMNHIREINKDKLYLF